MTCRKRVFLTGGTGNWGRATLRALAGRGDRFDVVALVRPTDRDREVIWGFSEMRNLHVVWGDLTDYATVESCVRGADYVLHVGGLVSPEADDNPELTRRVNVGSAANLVRAILAQPDPTAIAFVGIGSVAETGGRTPPVHWGRVGDPIRTSRYDEYALTKVAAEKLVVESGLPKWLWLRQSGIFHPGVLAIRDAIMTHVPFGDVMEWASVEDSARLLANVCEDSVPDELWCDVYNIGSGEAWRLTNWEFQLAITRAVGVGDLRPWYDRNWFATRNFHGHWYTDSDRLQELVPFREDTLDAALSRAVKEAGPSVRLAGRIPPAVVKHFGIKPLTRKPRGTMAAVRAGDDARIAAYFGSREQWEAIGGWDDFWPPHPDRTPSYLDHGYDEAKDPCTWTWKDLAGAADFRGGALLTTAEDHRAGDITTPLPWRCAGGHNFTASPRLVLSYGHWCPVCVADPAGYPRQAETNRFLAQVEPPA